MKLTSRQFCGDGYCDATVSTWVEPDKLVAGVQLAVLRRADASAALPVARSSSDANENGLSCVLCPLGRHDSRPLCGVTGPCTPPLDGTRSPTYFLAAHSSLSTWRWRSTAAPPSMSRFNGALVCIAVPVLALALAVTEA